VITFAEIREVHRKERESAKLVPLPDTFWKDVAEYFAEKMRKYEDLKKTSSKFTDKVLTQFERELRNAGNVLIELYTIREKKMLMLAWGEVGGSKADTRALTPEEREVFERIVEELRSARDRILANAMAGEKIESREEEKEEEEEMVRIKVLEKIPAFLGTDLNLYGPYEPGQVVELPARYAKLIVEKGKASIVEEKA